MGRVLTRKLEETLFYRERVPKFAKQLLVFSFVLFTWIFFRAASLSDAWLIVTRIFTSGWADPRFPVMILLLILAVWLYQLIYSSESRFKAVLDLAAVRVCIAAFMIAYLALFPRWSSEAFIYFQF